MPAIISGQSSRSLNTKLRNAGLICFRKVAVTLSPFLVMLKMEVVSDHISAFLIRRPHLPLGCFLRLQTVSAVQQQMQSYGGWGFQLKPPIDICARRQGDCIKLRHIVVISNDVKVRTVLRVTVPDIPPARKRWARNSFSCVDVPQEKLTMTKTAVLLSGLTSFLRLAPI